MLRRLAKISLGVALMILGIAGIFLPVVPGLLLLFIGFAFIINRSPRALFQEIIVRAKERYNKRYRKSKVQNSKLKVKKRV